MKITITDAEYPNIDEIERPILEAAGFDVVLAKCRSPEEVIESAQDAVGLIVQYAPIDRTVLTALPDVHIVSRYGVGMDTIDLQAARDTVFKKWPRIAAPCCSLSCVTWPFTIVTCVTGCGVINDRDRCIDRAA